MTLGLLINLVLASYSGVVDQLLINPTFFVYVALFGYGLVFLFGGGGVCGFIDFVFFSVDIVDFCLF